MTGYIVNCEMESCGPVLLLTRSTFWKDLPPGGALFADTREATVFPSRAEARAAIKRTMAYWREVHDRHHDWPDDAYSIRKLANNQAERCVPASAPALGSRAGGAE